MLFTEKQRCPFPHMTMGKLSQCVWVLTLLVLIFPLSGCAPAFHSSITLDNESCFENHEEIDEYIVKSIIDVFPEDQVEKIEFHGRRVFIVKTNGKIIFSVDITEHPSGCTITAETMAYPERIEEVISKINESIKNGGDFSGLINNILNSHDGNVFFKALTEPSVKEFQSPSTLQLNKSLDRLLSNDAVSSHLS